MKAPDAVWPVDGSSAWHTSEDAAASIVAAVKSLLEATGDTVAGGEGARSLRSLAFVSLSFLSLSLSVSVSVYVCVGHFLLTHFRSLCGQWD